MLVYVLGSNGKPLMPTERCGKVRRLLKSGRAIVKKKCPFTVQLLYETEGNIQEVSLGIDSGYRNIGFSATTENRELYASVVELRTDIVDLLSTRKEARHSRRGRKTRYRSSKYLNRVRSKHKGWLAPSVEERIDCHITFAKKICSLLPVSRIVVETTSFNPQLLKATLNEEKAPEGLEFQQGEQIGFWNLREYVLYRDGHKCRCCKGKSDDRILNVHHIVSRKEGGNRPDNLITLCKTCHAGYHNGTVKLSAGLKKMVGYKEASFMSISRWKIYTRLKEMHPDVHMTFGYLTKYARIRCGLKKEHYIDAGCISGNPEAKSVGFVFYQRKIRRHNRQIHKYNTIKGGKRKNNQAAYEVKGFRLFDKVRYNGIDCFIVGRRTRGYFELRTMDGQFRHHSAWYKKLRFIDYQKGYLTEMRMTGSETIS